MTFKAIFQFWARTSPKTPMQRLGAFLMGINSIACAVIVLSTIVRAVFDDWTIAGVTGGVFGLCMVLLLLPIGIAHGLAAIFPRALESWRPSPNTSLERLKMRFADRLRDMYSIVGWFASLCAIALLIYALAP